MQSRFKLNGGRCVGETGGLEVCVEVRVWKCWETPRPRTESVFTVRDIDAGEIYHSLIDEDAARFANAANWDI